VRPVQLRVRPAPRREPPFDDEFDPAESAVGPFDRPLPLELRVRSFPVVPPAARNRSNDLPEPAAWARRLLVGIVEAAAGRRPLSQLAGMLSPGVAAGLRSDLVTTGGTRRHWTAGASVRSVHATEPTATTAELAATLSVGPRVRAVALRLEVRHSRWCCTRLVLG
jgi:hypothetical protein